MEKTLVILAALAIQVKVAFSQQLITNGDFEQLDSCPKYVGDIQVAHGWHNGGMTPDLFSTCTNGHENGLNIPDNYAGSKKSINGNCYAGIVLFTKRLQSPDKKNYELNESIWTNLAVPTSLGKVYELKFWVAPADSSYFTSKYITATLSANSFNEKESNTVQVLIISIEDESVSLDGWKKVSMTFTSDKNWRYISIGLLRNVFSYKQYLYSIDKNKLKKGHSSEMVCYYYIDNISLLEIGN